MASSPTEQLTDGQRECLRLVLSHHNSKEIAALLGVSPSAVDKRIERAVQVLNATTRFTAARILAEHEGGSVSRKAIADHASEPVVQRTGTDEQPLVAERTSERLPSEPFDLPIPLQSTALSASDGPLWLVGRLMGLAPQTDRDAGDRNKLTRLQRLGVVAALMIVVAVTSMILLNIGQTLSVLAREHKVARSR